MVFAHRLYRIPYGLAGYSVIQHRMPDSTRARYYYPQELIDGVVELLPTHPKVVRAAKKGSPYLGQYLCDLICVTPDETGGFYFHDVADVRLDYEQKLQRRQARLESLDLIEPIYKLYTGWYDYLNALPYDEANYQQNFETSWFPFKSEDEYRAVGQELIKLAPEGNPFRVDLEQHPEDSRFIIKGLEGRLIFLCDGKLNGKELEQYSRDRMMLSANAHMILTTGHR